MTRDVLSAEGCALCGTEGFHDADCPVCGKPQVPYEPQPLTPDQAFELGAEKERQRVVAWLGSEADAAYDRNEPESGLDYRLMAKRIDEGAHHA